MDTLTQFLIILTLFELIEANLQKSHTVGEMIDKLYIYYDKSIFLFFMIHPTFYFVLFVSLYLDIINFYIVTILLIKTLDMFFKIELIQQRYIKKEIEPELKGILELKMTSWMGILGVFTYVPMLFMAIFP